MKEWKGFRRGINLGGWLSQCEHTKERHDTFITEEDIKKISEWGLDHVRIPIDYELVEDENGEYIEEGFSYIDNALKWCGKYGLGTILDLHKTYGFSFDIGENETGFFDNADYQERFYRLWECFAGRYGNMGDRVAFEFLNEVTDKEFCEKWNTIAGRCVERIRAITQDTKILIGGYYNNSVEAVKDLAMPHDENIVYNFHCYEPLIFTHQGAYWVPEMPSDLRTSIDETYGQMKKKTDELGWIIAVGFEGFDPDDTLDEKYFMKYFEEAVKVAEERDVPLYCGEYGVIDLAEPADTLKWYKYINKAFEKYNIGRAAWSYKEMDYGFVDEHMKDVVDEVVKYL